VPLTVCVSVQCKHVVSCYYFTSDSQCTYYQSNKYICRLTRTALTVKLVTQWGSYISYRGLWPVTFIFKLQIHRRNVVLFCVCELILIFSFLESGLFCSIWLYGPKYRSRYTESLRAGRFGDRIKVGRDFLQPSRPALRLTQPPTQWMPGLFLGRKSGRGVALTTHPNLASRLKKI
jgi:hypothetical protein